MGWNYGVFDYALGKVGGAIVPGVYMEENEVLSRSF